MLGACRQLLPLIRRSAETSGQRRKLFSRGCVMDTKLLDILACPLCKGALMYDKSSQELICKVDRLAYPIRDGIPVMLEDEARQLAPDEEVR